MLIDTGFFEFERKIVDKDTDAVKPNLLAAIAKYEAEFLRLTLGDVLAREFLTGIAQPVPAQKWVDLLEGCSYYDGSNNLQFWRGLRTITDLTPITVNGAEANYEDSLVYIREFIPGRGLSGGEVGSGSHWEDPLLDGSTLTDEKMKGATYDKLIVEIRGVGFLTESEYNILPDGGIELLTATWMDGNPVKVTRYNTVRRPLNYDGEFQYYTLKQSPIADYVYYWFVRDLHQQMTAISTVKNKGENSVLVSPDQKLTKAWNDMAEWVRELYAYLYATNGIYGWNDYGYWAWFGYPYAFWFWHPYHCRESQAKRWNLTQKISLL